MAFNNGLHLGFGMVVVAMVMEMSCVISTGWAHLDISVGIIDTIEYGLYRACVVSGSRDECTYYKESDIDEQLQAARIMATIGFGFFGFASGLISVYMFLLYKDRTKPRSNVPLIGSIACAGVGGVLNITAAGVYGDYNDSLTVVPTLHWAFYLYLIATVLGFSGSIVAYVGRPKPIEPGQGVTYNSRLNGANVTVIHQSYPATGTYPSGRIKPPPYGHPSSYPTYPTGNPQYPQAYQGFNPANQGYNPAYPPANQSYNPAYPPANQGFNPAYPPADQGYNPAYPPANQGYNPNPAYPPNSEGSNPTAPPPPAHYGNNNQPA